MAKNSINAKIFMALKVSEMSKVPVLILSNPGIGKTTTVEMYAKLRKDEKGRPMDVVSLRGNSESPETIHGYETVSTAPVKAGEAVMSSHTRPSWMQRILDNDAQGIRTILFLDELTTANEFVQAALLHLIFDRKCGVEELPPTDRCLIVAAGNYMNNLSTSMTVISPVWNRFMIFNVTPTANDLPDFLCKYRGALSSGTPMDSLAEVEKELSDLDKQELKLSESKFNKIGEYFEKSVAETARLLMTREGKMDLSVTDLRDIYGDVDESDPNIYGFPSFRTLNYLRDISIACYKCFGKPGIQSDNFRTMINGLCGVGVTKETKGSQTVIKTHKIGPDFFDSLSRTAVELDKLASSKLPEYIEYFQNIVTTSKGDKKKASFDTPELNAIKNKLDEMCKDVEMKNIERPLEVELLTQLSTAFGNSTKDVPTLKYDGTTGTDIRKTLEDAGITVEMVGGFVTSWNTLAQTYNAFNKFVNFGQWKYNSDATELVSKLGKSLSRHASKLVTLRRIVGIAAKSDGKDAGISKIIPEIETIVG